MNKNKFIIFLVCFFVGGLLYAQSSGEVYTIVDEPASFKGGMSGFYAYVGKSIKYPSTASRNKTQGKVVIQFIVNPDGKLSDIKVLKGIGDGCDEEATRVMKSSPNWIAGKQNGEPVKVRMVVPIVFKLN